MEAEALVQRQLDAYNAHDLEAFLATYAEDITLFRLPDPEPVLSGREALAAFYATRRFRLPDLRAECLQRAVLGGRIVDHERVFGIEGGPSEVVVIYEVAEGLIRRVWMVPRA